MDRLRSAFALESIIDELIFSVGPLVTAFLAFQLGLPLPLRRWKRACFCSPAC
jgi:hypothetical protein